jgi:cell division protein FtsI (penicillin-binding protein 3)
VKAEKLPASRVKVLAVIMAVWGLGIGARLYFLQVVESRDYIKKAKSQQQVSIKITPRRGDILDRNGNALAVSVSVDSVFANPFEMKDPQKTARILSQLTGVPYDVLLKKFDPEETFVWVKRKISAAERSAIEQAHLPGVEFQKEFRRFYPHREMASHLIGYVDIDERGQSGLESRYNLQVRGQDGRIRMLRDAKGKSFQREEQVPQAGANLTTTIDTNIQFIVEKELRDTFEKTHAAAVSIVVLDPRSGAILAMANAPTFNPNEASDFDASTWINHSVSLTYEPGSTFKMVAVAAALEEGLITPDDIFDCQNGAIHLGSRTIKDHDPFGLLSVREIIQHSSNVGTIKIAQKVGEELFSEYIRKMGFGKRTGVDLPAEVNGRVAPLKDWGSTSYASIAIGQEVSVTPLQITSFLAAVANGGILYKPYVVQKVQDPLGRIVDIKPSGHRILPEMVAQQIQEMLEGVVEEGTAKGSKLEGYRAAGKTGTAQKAEKGKGYSGGKFVSSFVGFAPASNPQLAIAVIVDEPKGQHYGAQVAAPAFKRIAEQVLSTRSVVPDIPNYAPRYTAAPNKSKPAPKPTPTPQVPEFKVLDAGLGLPAEGSNEPLGLGEIIVPDLAGQSKRQALIEVGKLGLEPVNWQGAGFVTAQHPPAGSRVLSGARIQLKFSQRK